MTGLRFAADGVRLPITGKVIVTVTEYEERFRRPWPSLYQIFAESQGPSWRRRRRRRMRIVAVISAIIALATEIGEHYADHGDNRHLLIGLWVITALGKKSLCPTREGR